ncbi:hypothetical protein G7Z17_g10733 [Cylindrodendrum hubeiense]|uniref:Uncharacterized protein n=1 Tax=Cylindrodendrum hubeiense TaxID=595255 RepID=A0A9P5H4D4_9HYPO|nr:hypothetical protein G7Z17_g10733 [Cylindrodendrum hubeiense]
MMDYCFVQNNVGPYMDLDMSDVPCGSSAVVDTVSDEAPAPSSTCLSSSGADEPSRRSFMDLPSEIRLQIYHWLHLMCPVRHAQLAPWYPTPVHCQYILRRLVDPASSTADEAPKTEPNQAPAAPSPGMLSPFRPLSGLPTGFLQSNSQIYHESRLIPFTKNEFVFVNWFASGLWAARAFTRALEPWQRREMRFIRLEILARDIVGNGGGGGGSGQEEWLSLCDDWAAGARGLRMKMVLGGTATGVMATSMAAGTGLEPEKEGTGFAELQTEARRRIAGGLSRMRSLERVEMELVTRELSNGEKLRWCKDLEEELNATAGLERVRVVSTEKLQEKMEWIKQGIGLKHLQGLTDY